MAEVVFRSTQHLDAADLRAMAVYLQALPQTPPPRAAVTLATPEVMALGERLYAEQCADCHGEQGQGRPGVWPALAGNRAVLMDPPTNVLAVILAGGFPPTTRGHPQPHGMPPFRALLTPAEVAAVASYIRQAWQPKAAAVSEQDVLKLR
jgi:mono/diheme cytochrome c family protein